MASELYNKILSRGYWRVIIRPTSFEEKHVNEIASLYPIIEKTKVEIRGWDFPHVDYKNSYTRGLDFIEQEFEWEHHKSIWRFYQSGQFYYLDALSLDWRDESKLWPADGNWKPGKLLGIGDTIATLTEIYEFAARLAFSEGGSNFLNVDITVGNLKDRLLYMDAHRRWPMRVNYRASIEKYPYKKDFSRSELEAQSKEIALQIAKDLFQRFGWDSPTIDTLRNIQQEFKI